MNEDLMTFLVTIGASSIITALMAFFFDHAKKKKGIKFESLMEEKKGHYQHLLTIMQALFDPNAEDFINNGGPLAEKKKADLFQKHSGEKHYEKKYREDQFQIELRLVYLFASDKVIESLEFFDKDKNSANYKLVAREMYKDLWK